MDSTRSSPKVGYGAAASPAHTLVEGIDRALASLAYLTAHRIYVNDGDEADANGIAAHSICAVVQGGLPAQVAQAIYLHKAPGIGTHGAASGTYTDEDGVAHVVRFQRATNTRVTFTVELTVSGSFDQTAAKTAIQRAVYDFMSQQGIGQDLITSRLYGVIYGAYPEAISRFTVTLLAVNTSAGATSATLACAWNQIYSLYSAEMVAVSFA